MCIQPGLGQLVVFIVFRLSFLASERDTGTCQNHPRYCPLPQCLTTIATRAIALWWYDLRSMRKKAAQDADGDVVCFLPDSIGMPRRWRA